MLPQDQQPFAEYDRLLKKDPLLKEIRENATHMGIKIKSVGGTMRLLDIKQTNKFEEFHSEFASSVVIRIGLGGSTPLLLKPRATSDLWHMITEVFQHHFTDYPSSVTIKYEPPKPGMPVEPGKPAPPPRSAQLEITLRPPINRREQNIPMYSTTRYLFPGGDLAPEAPFQRELRGFLESLGFGRQDIQRCMDADHLKMIPPPSFVTVGDQINDELNNWRGLKTSETQEARTHLMEKIFKGDSAAFAGLPDLHPETVQGFFADHKNDTELLDEVRHTLHEHRKDIVKIKAADFILLKLEVLLKAINTQHHRHDGRRQVIDKITDALGVEHTHIMRDLTSKELLVSVPETDKKKKADSTEQYVRLIDVLLEMDDLAVVKQKLQPISLAVYMGQLNPENSAGRDSRGR